MAALALAGEDTADRILYTDAIATRADLVAVRERVTIVSRVSVTPTTSD